MRPVLRTLFLLLPLTPLALAVAATPGEAPALEAPGSEASGPAAGAPIAPVSGPVISGLVLSADFHTLPGARVSITPLDDNYRAGSKQLRGEAGSQPRTAACDASGHFRIIAPGPAVYRVRIEAPGHLAVVHRPLPVTDDVELPPVFLQPAVDAVLEFKRRGGEPVAGAFIAVSTSARGPVPAVPPDAALNGWRAAPRSGRTDLEGRLVVDRAAGEWLDLAIVPPWSHRPQRILGVEGVRYFLDPAPVPGGALRIEDAEGRPVAGVLALLGAEGLPVGLSGADGRLEIKGQIDEPEPLLLLAEDGRRAATWYVTPPPDVEVPRRLPALEMLRGRTLSITDKRPLADALIWSSRDPGRFTTSATDGSWSLADVATGGLWIEGRAQGHLPRLLKSETRRPFVEGPIELVLEAEARLEGTVVDAGGRPLPHVELRLESARPWPSFRLDRARGRAMTDANGRFRIPTLWLEGQYRLNAWKLGYTETWLDVERRQMSDPLQVVLRPEQAAFGWVVDTEEAPVAGARVRVLPADGRPARAPLSQDAPDPYLGITDTEGRFELATLPAPVITLEASGPGFAPMKIRGLEVVSTAEGPADLGTLVLVKGERLAGRVLDEGGAPLPDAAVWVVDAVRPSLRHQVEEVRRSEPGATSDEAGHFSLPDLVPGRALSLLVFRSGYLPRALEGVEVPATGPLDVRLAVAATVAGRVIDDEDRPIAGASVTLDPEVIADGSLEPTDVSGDDYQSAHTDEEGRYLFDLVTPGSYRASANSDAHQPADPRPIEVKAEQPLEEVDFVLEEGAVLTGVALTEDDEPLHGVRITVGPAYDLSDRQGRFEVLGIPPGPQPLEGRHPSLPVIAREIDIQEGSNETELVFPRGFEIEGRVLDSAGSPVAGVSVVFAGGRHYAQHRAQSDGDGYFLLDGVGAGGYELRASKKGFAPHVSETPLDAEQVAETGMRITLEGGARIAGRLQGLDFEDLERVRVVAQRGRREAQGRVDYEGRYAIEDLGAGDWLVRARVPGTGLEAHARVPLVGGEEASQDLDFESGVSLSGQVLWNGSPLPRTHVAVRGLDVAVERQTASDHEGRFELRNLRPGLYRIDASNTREILTQNLDVELRSDREVQIEFETSKVHGRIIAEHDGGPLHNAMVFLQRHLEGSSEPGSMATVGTREDGSFRFGRLNRGSYELTVKLDGFEPLRESLEVESDVGPLELALRAADGLELVVRRLDGVTPPYIQYSVTGPTGSARAEGRQVETGGLVRLPNLPAGDFTLWITAPGAAPASLDVRVPSPEPIAVELEPAGELHVRVPSLVRVDGLAQLRLYAADGQPWRAFDVDTGRPLEAWPVVAGVARVEGLPPGQWRVEVEDPAGTRWESGATTAGGQLTRLHLE